MKKSYKLKTRLALGVACLMLGFNISAQVDVVATAGSPTASYATLDAAFAAINAGTHQGMIGIGISGNTVEVGSCVLNSSGAGAASYTSILISPTVDGVSISGPTLQGRGLIELKGADNVTIDGDNPNSAGVNKNLSIINTAASTVTYTSCVRIATAATVVTSADNILIQNCIINGSATGRNTSGTASTTGSENTTFGIYVGGNGGATATDVPAALTSVTTNSIPAGATVNAFSAINNSVNVCARAIVFNGSAAASSTSVIITGNIIGDQSALTGSAPFTTPATTVYVKGVLVAGTTSLNISGNTIKNILSYVGTTINGIELLSGIGAGTIAISNNTISGLAQNGTGGNIARGILVASAGGPYTISGNSISNIQSQGTAAVIGLEVSVTGATIERNMITKVHQRNNTTYGAYGINLNGGANQLVQNNFVSDIKNDQTGGTGAFSTTFGVHGIRIASAIGHKLYNNSVSFSGAHFGNTNTDLVSCLTIVATGSTGMDIRNNILSNTMTGGNASGTRFACLWLPTGATVSMNLTLNNNAYYASTDANGILAQVGATFGTGQYLVANFNAGAITPATNLRAYTSPLSAAGTNDNASFASLNAAPFVSATDLHLNLASGEIVNVEQKGDPAVVLTTDIDGNARPNAPTTNPDMGADEVILSSCVSADGGTITPSSYTRCDGQTVSLSSTGTSTGTGITYQWKVSTVSGGPYTSVTGGSGATTTSYTSGALAAGVYYYVLETTCSLGPVSDFSNEATVTVNSAPVVTVSPTSASICQPGGSAVALTAGGATSYTWGPAGGLDLTSGTTVNALPAVTTTYTVTGTDGIGCTATATTTITVNPGVIGVTATATPASVCSGANSQLLAQGTIASPVSNYQFATATGVALAPMAGATTALTSGNDDTPTAAPAAIGFPFNFNGVNYSQFSVSPDGWILLGGATAVAEWTNVVTSTTNVPRIYPFWDDNATGTNGNVTYVVNGTAPNRILVVQWMVTVPRNTTGAANSTFQAWLHENSGRVDFVYGTMGTPTSGSISAGLTGSATSYQSITFSSNTSSSSTTNDVNTTAPASGRQYSFTPVLASNYLWTPSAFIAGQETMSNPVATAVTATTTYTVTVTNGTCSSTGSVTLTAGATLSSTANTTPAAGIVCEGGSVTLNSVPAGGGAPYTYAWSGPNGFVSTNQNAVVSTAPVAATGTYTVTVTDNCGATSSNTVMVTINANPTVSVTPSSATYCAPGAPVSLAASGTATTYAWLPATGLSTSTGANVDASPSATTTYTVTGTDANGCMATSTAAIASSRAVLVSSVTASPAAICEGGNATVTANAMLAPVTYCASTHSNGCGLGDEIQQVMLGTINNVSTCAATAYTYFNGGGTQTTTLLGGNAYSVSVKFGTDGTQFFGAWIDYNQNGTLEASEFLGASANAGVSGTIAVAFTVPAGAMNGVTRLRIVGGNDTPVTAAQACGASSSNYGETEDYDVTIANGAMSFTYAWTPSTFLASTTANPAMVSAATAGTTYSVTVTSTGGCSATGSAAIAVNPIPSAPAASGTTICSGSTATLMATGSGTIGWYDAATGGTHVGSGASFTTPALTSATTYYVQDSSAAGCASPRTAVTVTANSLPVVSANTTAAAVCAGGMVTLTGGGATSYTWAGATAVSDGVAFTPSATDTYTVTGTDGNGCMDTETVTVTVNALPVVTANTTATAVCAGTMVTLTGGGATSYTWDNSVMDGVAFSPMASMTYMVTGTDGNGCMNTASVMVAVNSAPVVALGADITQCGGTVLLDAGNAGLDFLWSNASVAQMLSVNVSGTFSVAVTDPGTGCTGRDTINVTFNTVPVVALGSDIVQCGGTVMLDAGNTGATYMWSDASTGQTLSVGMTGTYYVNVNNGSCAAGDTVNVTINAIPSVTLAPFTVPVCDDATVFALTGGSPAGGVYSGTAVAAGMFDPSAAGAGMHLITYTVVDSNSCTNADTASITVDLCSGIAENSNAEVFTVYPNPANGMVNVAVNDADFSQLTISIVDMQGKEVYNETDKNITKNYNKQINIETLAKGVYYIRMNTGSNSRIQKLIVH